jgi:putative addiction module component (TIGR02574 family)
MYNVVAQRVQVVVERLFQMDQRTLSRAVGPVLQRGQWYGLRLAHRRSTHGSSGLDLCATDTGVNMPMPMEQIEAEAMKLSPQERADLADKLWLSVHPADEVEAAWDAEIARRMQQIDAGEVETVPWDTVMAELRAKLG